MIYGFDEKRLEQIPRHAKERIEKKLLLGACSAIVRGDQLVYTSCEGYSDLNKTPLKPDAMFRLASMSKPITACAIMIQSERGCLRITDPVSQYLPEFENMKLYDGTAARPITIRHLLSHCSGLGHDEIGDREFAAHCPREGDTLATAVPRYAQMRLTFQPGDRGGYSPIVAFDILGRIVEVTSGLRFEDFLQENIFKPLRMKDTTFHPTREQRARLVQMCTADGAQVVDSAVDSNFPGLPETYEAGSAGIVSSLSDYTRFARMLLGRGQLDGARVVTPRTVEQMRSRAMPYMVPGVGDEVQWGLGMRIIQHLNGYSAPLSVGAFGWSGAFGTHFFVDPALDVAAVYMSNLANGGGAGAPTAFEFENDVISAIVE